MVILKDYRKNEADNSGRIKNGQDLEMMKEHQFVVCILWVIYRVGACSLETSLLHTSNLSNLH